MTPAHWFSTWEVVAPLVGRKNVVEIGPGTRPRAPIGRALHLDLSMSALRKLNMAGGFCACSRADRLPVATGFADTVIAFDVIEHVEEDEAFFSELARILKPGGWFFFSVPLHQSLYDKFDEVAGHFRRYDPAGLAILLASRGFEVKSWYAFGSRPRSVFVDRVGAWWLRRHPSWCAWCRDVLFRSVGRSLQRRLSPCAGNLSSAGLEVAGAAVVAIKNGVRR